MSGRVQSTVGIHRRLASLDVLRGIAISLVVFGHYMPGRVIGDPFAHLFRPFAVGGVVLFFLLSGFLIERNLLRETQPIIYGLRRLFRVLPAYWVSLLVLVLVHRGFLSNDSYGQPGDVLANALLLPDVLKAPLLSAVFWTLLVESKFYLLAPFLMHWGRRAVIAAPFAAMSANAVIATWRGEASNLLTYLTFCLVGMCFGPWYRREISGSVLVVIAATAAISVGVFSPHYKLGLVVFALINVTALAYALRNGLAVPGLAFIGSISYSWYLYHAGIGYPLMAALESAPIAVSAAVSTLVAMVVTLAMAWASYRYVERPAIALGRTMEKNRLAGQPFLLGIWR